jgi:DNA adenine methylase
VKTFAYLGGKQKLSPWILQHFPKSYKLLIDGMAGSGIITLESAKLGVTFDYNSGTQNVQRIYNDLYEPNVNFFECLRDNPDLLMGLIDAYTETYWESALDRLDLPMVNSETKFLSAAKHYLYCEFSWRGGGSRWSSGLRTKVKQQFPGVNTDHLREVYENLRGVIISHTPISGLLKNFRDPDHFFYMDPPYLGRTMDKRGDAPTRNQYFHDLAISDHIDLLQAIRNHPAKILISNYRNILYDQILDGWNRYETSTSDLAGKKRTEVLWANY